MAQIFRHNHDFDFRNVIDLDADSKISTDDIITMIIDCGRKTVDFYKNDKHVYQCNNVHPSQYRLAIELCAAAIDEDDEVPGYDEVFPDIPASVTLQSFSISACN